MAIKAGQFLHDANGFVVDRIQTGGVGNLNIPEEKIYELGNYQTVATVRDIADLSFDAESLDVSSEFEAILLGIDPTTTNDGDEFDFAGHLPIDVISPFKAGSGSFAIVRGLAIPYLTLESATYRFGLRANATQAFTLRGDSIYYVPGSPYYQRFTLVDGTLAYTLTNTALPYDESGDTLYVLGACVKNPTTNAYKRLFFGTDYTNTATVITLVQDEFDNGYTQLHVVYGSTTAADYPQSVHQTTAVKPAAVRGKDIDVYLGDTAATPVFSRWTGVQGFEVTRRVNLDNDEEFGNAHYVASDYDTAEVSGSITVRDRTAQDLWSKIHTIADVPTNEVIGTMTSVTLPVELRVNDPDTGDRLKTLYVPDARFQVPAMQGRVQQKLEVTFNFSSDSGELLVYQGER